MSKGNVLVTGGCGYIGSHTLCVLLDSGYDVTVVDNLANSSQASLERVQQITGCDAARIAFHDVDCADEAALTAVFEAQKPKGPFVGAIHFAGLKAVGESTQIPLRYYENNIGSTLALLKVMEAYDCRTIIFSSSATVYGNAPLPFTETSQTGVGVTNAYGRTKFMIEEILKDFANSPKGKDWAISLLRYFNPCGAHPSGRIGEDPSGVPNNLMPFVAQVAVGRREKVTVFGNDFPTKDGTGVRDYIHVMDLAEGHHAALEFLRKQGTGCFTHNLGSGTGSSVLEMLAAMGKAAGKEIPYAVGPRREGDLAEFYANTDKAREELGWHTTRGLDEMCADLWRWQTQNPQGYNTQ